MAWCFEDESSEFADHILDLLSEMRAVVPAIWPLEVANALLVSERRKRLDEARTRRFVELLAGLPIDTDEHTGRHALGATVHLARAHALSSYDAAYLELALRLGLPLATLDDRLKAAAVACGVSSIDRQ